MSDADTNKALMLLALACAAYVLVLGSLIRAGWHALKEDLKAMRDELRASKKDDTK